MPPSRFPRTPLSPPMSRRPPLTHTPRPSDENLMAPHRVVHHAVLRLYEDLVAPCSNAKGGSRIAVLDSSLASTRRACTMCGRN